MARSLAPDPDGEEYFRRYGFVTVPRTQGDPRLVASAEFQDGHCVAAVLMVRPVP